MCAARTVASVATNTVRTMWWWTAARGKKRKASPSTSYDSLLLFLLSVEAKVRDQRSANPSNDLASELYCDDDMSLKERLSRAEAVSCVTL